MNTRTYRALFPFCGLGLGARGFLDGMIKLLGTEARFESMGGIDFDAAACEDFEYLTDSPSWCADIAELTVADIVARYGPVAPDVIFLSPPCLPGDGPVITAAGDCAIETLRANDLVLTHRGRFRRVLAVGTHLYHGDMFGIRVQGTPDAQSFTADHPIWVSRVLRPGPAKKRKLSAPTFVPAKDVKVGDRIGFPIQAEETGCARRFVEAFGDPRLIRKGGKTTGRWTKPAHDALLKRRVVDLRAQADNVNLWFLIGAYLGDGYRRKSLHKSRHEVIFCVGPEEGEFAANVRDALDKLKLAFNIDRNGGATNVKVRVHSRHLCMLLGAFGDGAARKDIPPALMGLELPLLEALIGGYRSADGSERQARARPAGQRGGPLLPFWKIISTSLPLLRSVQRLLLRRGEYGAIHVAWAGGPQTIMGRKVNTRPRWEIKVMTGRTKRATFEFMDGAIWIRVRSIDKRAVVGERVWNLEVEEDNTFCAPLIATHNCKGSSGLLSEAKSKTPKYVAMNDLALKWTQLMLGAWADAPPRLVILENVPRIKIRAAPMLRKLRALLRAAGYVFSDGYHDCGELGGLAQHRRRYLLVARHAKRVPPLLYQPPKRRVRACGEVLEQLPMPDDPAGGPMHIMPRISWLNWVRLALIPAGGDWRDLPGVIAEGAERRSKFKRHPMENWAAPTGTVGGPGSNGVGNVADPRPSVALGQNPNAHRNKFRVGDWDAPTGAVIGAGRPGSGALSVADPRPAVAMNLGGSTHDNVYAVTEWDEPAGTVTSGRSPGGGGISVADPRPGWGGGRLGVLDPAAPAGSVTGESLPTNGPFAIADDRLGPGDGANWFKGKYGVTGWSEPARTVIGGFSNGAGGVADPRVPDWFRGILGVIPWSEPSGVVTGGAAPARGGFSVADPRVKRAFDNGYRVLSMDEPSPTVAGASMPGNGAYSVSDPRWPSCVPLTCEPRERSNVLGVIPWTEAAKTVTGHARIDNGAFAVCDPRVPGAPPLMVIRDVKKPPPAVPIIIAEDGTWHRPLTTLELAVLQDMPAIWKGAPLKLAGTSSSAWRERIGNAVPRGAAQAIAERMLTCLLQADLEAFALSGDGDVWVAPDERAGAAT